MLDLGSEFLRRNVEETFENLRLEEWVGHVESVQGVIDTLE